ncbi:alkaline phosphatase family protein [Myxococcota bacterium]|nr:alkaline phosphatase family protein [Myxococcota bacterium]
MSRPSATNAALFGAAFAPLPGLAVSAAVSVVNPWFIDSLGLLLALLVLAPAALGALLGGLIGLRRPRASAPSLTFGATAALTLALALWPEPSRDPVRVLVVGIDGATFDLIDPMVAEGELPALQSLATEGSRGVLMSMEPMFSPLLWTTMASGVPPEEHGIHGFHTRATDVQAPRLWDIAEDAGLRVGIYKWLVTYPPRPVPGFIVPSWLAPAPDTFPAELSFVKELELANRMRRKKVAGTRSTTALVLAGIPQGLRLSTLWDAVRWSLRERIERPDDDARFEAMQLLRGRIDRDVFVHAMHKHQPDLATFTYYATDGLAHRFWTYHQPEAFTDIDPQKQARYGDAVRGAYRQADLILGELIHRVSPETTVVVVSDHGFRAFDPALDQLGFQPLTERLRARLIAQGLPVDVSRLGIKLNVSLTEGGAARLPELKAALEALVDEHGAPVFRVEPVPGAPSALGLTLTDERVTEARLQTSTVGGEPLSDYVRLSETFSGMHDARGVIYAKGPGLPVGQTLPSMGLLDVAPTIQALLGIHPAQDLPGVIALGQDRLPKDQSAPQSRDELVERFRPKGGTEGVDEAALKALGYIE